MSVNSQGVRSTIDFAKHVGAGPGILVDGNGLRRCIQKSGASPGSRDSSSTTSAATSDSVPDAVTGRRLPAALLESLPTQQTDSRPHAR